MSISAPVLLPTVCAICGTAGNAVELYGDNFDLSSFNPVVFSARRTPDGLHYRMVKCAACGLVRSDPVGAPDAVAALYARSSVGYGAEIANIRRTYGRHLARVKAPAGGAGRALLEIGCGNGFFLEEALRQGFATVKGVEPSAEALRSAPERVRAAIVTDVMRAGLFPPASFDVVCMFHVLDHLPDPSSVLAECRKALRAGGAMLCISHNIRAVSARIMGPISPIIDIEHTYLFSRRTAALLFSKCGFAAIKTGIVFNSYSLRYILHMLPTPVLRRAADSPLGLMRVRLPLGNFWLVATKP